jgi:hypothetical protein
MIFLFRTRLQLLPGDCARAQSTQVVLLTPISLSALLAIELCISICVDVCLRRAA